MPKRKNIIRQEVIVTPKGNYVVPSLAGFLEDKAAETRTKAAQHILQQDTPNIPRIPSQGLDSKLAAWVYNMSDEERIRRFGTADPETCIYTATSQYNDKGALVSGNVTFRNKPSRYGFTQIPMDSAQVGDLIQFSLPSRAHGLIPERPIHSVMVTDKDSNGKPLVSYSNGNSTPFFVEDGDTIFTMKQNKPLSEFGTWIPAAFRYAGSPEKKEEWRHEYLTKYNLDAKEYKPVINVTEPSHAEQPDALKVVKPQIIQPVKRKAEGGNLYQPKDAWEALSMAAKAEMMEVAVKNGITDLKEIKQKYNEFAEGEEISDKEYISTMEKVAEENYQKWGFNNPDEALVHALNDNTYNYRGYYNKYPQSQANADTHWTDEFKTVYHPTFSRESIYSGKVSQYNPNGKTGGFWLTEETFVPAFWQLFSNYADGGKIHIKSYVLEGKRYYKNGGVLEGDFDVDDLSKNEIMELNRLGYTIEIL